MKTGLMYGLLAAMFWGIAPLFEKMGLGKIEPLTAVAVRSFAISTVLLIGFLSTGKLQELAKLDMRSCVLIMGGGICASLVGQWMFFKSLKAWEASRAVPTAAAYPLVAMLLAILLLGEKLTLGKGLGTALIVIGISLLH